MNSAWLESLATVAHDVLRTTAFALPERSPKEELLPPEGETLLASILFQGDSRGEMCLVVDRQLAASLSSDILSEDAEDLTNGQVEDTCKELLNIICGQWLTAVYGPVPVFKLAAPTARPIETLEWSQLRDGDNSVGLSIDDQPVLITITAADSVDDTNSTLKLAL